MFFLSLIKPLRLKKEVIVPELMMLGDLERPDAGVEMLSEDVCRLVRLRLRKY
jgi:hypothetical protein